MIKERVVVDHDPVLLDEDRDAGIGSAGGIEHPVGVRVGGDVGNEVEIASPDGSCRLSRNR